jgi:hypothetical protein
MAIWLRSPLIGLRVNATPLVRGITICWIPTLMAAESSAYAICRR